MKSLIAILALASSISLDPTNISNLDKQKKLVPHTNSIDSIDDLLINESDIHPPASPLNWDKLSPEVRNSLTMLTSPEQRFFYFNAKNMDILLTTDYSPNISTWRIKRELGKKHKIPSNYILHMRGGRERVQEGLDRSQEFKDLAQCYLEQNGFSQYNSELLVFLFLYESRFNPNAGSKKGAIGLGQLMPETAQEFGLKVNIRKDDRYNPDLNLDASTRLLAEIVDDCYGNLYAAPIFYHGGHNAPKRRFKTLEKNDKELFNGVKIESLFDFNIDHVPPNTKLAITSFNGGAIGAESNSYLYFFLGVAQIGSHPEELGFTVPKNYSRPSLSKPQKIPQYHCPGAISAKP